MGIKRFFANKDTTIVNSFKDDLSTRSVLSNTGMSDVLEVYSIYSRISADSLEKSRILISFDLEGLPALGLPEGTRYYLKLFNAAHSESLPRNFKLTVKPISSEWEEGLGLDLIGYSDEDQASWLAKQSTRIPQVITIELATELPAAYANQTISIFSTNSEKYNFYFKVANEENSAQQVGVDVEVDISGLEAGETVTDKLLETLQAHESFNASVDNGVIQVTNAFPGLSESPIATILPEPADQPTLNVVTPGSNYTPWINAGGDYSPVLDDQQQEIVFEQLMQLGTEDLSIDITDIVNSWLSADQNSLTDFGLGIMLEESYENGSRGESFYTKRFFARESEFFFKRPVVEARYNNSIKDDTNSLVTASPHKSDTGNTMKVYYQNFEKGVPTDLLAAPNFTLTTDKAMADKVTLEPANASNSILDSPSSDYTENAYVQIKVNNTSAATGFGWSNSLIIVTHTDQDSNEETQFSFVSRYSHWSAPGARNDVYPLSVANTLENRIAAAQAIATELNEYPGFSALFVAEATGESVRIYTKVQGNAGQLSSVSVFAGSNTPSDFLIFEQTSAHAAAAFEPFVADDDPDLEGDQPAGNDYDSIALLDDAGWTVLRGEISMGDVLNSNLALDDRGLTFNRKTRTFRGNSGVVAESITSQAVTGYPGLYVAEFKIANNIAVSTLYKKWWIGNDEASGLIAGHNGSLPVAVSQWYDSDKYHDTKQCILSIENLQPTYSPTDRVRLNVLAIEKGRAPNVVTKNLGKISSTSLRDCHFKLFRVSDGTIIIDYDVQNLSTLLSCGENSNYFDLDVSILEPGYLYGLQFKSISVSNEIQHDEVFKFRVS